MGCLKLTYQKVEFTPLKVVYRKPTLEVKGVQRFIGVDPLADAPLNVGTSPYAYVWNNPLKFIDPTGMHGESVDGDYIDWKGKVIGNDGNDDNKIHLVKNKKDIKQIKNNNKQGGSTSTDEVDIALTTTTTVLEEAMHVLNRTKGHAEETSVVTGDGQVVRGKKGKGFDGKYSSARLPNLPGEDNTSIHSHPTAVIGGIGFNALQPGDLDPEAFKHFGSNVIVGAFGPPQTQHGVRIERTQGAAFFGSNITTASKPKAILSRSAITRALWTINNR